MPWDRGRINMILQYHPDMDMLYIELARGISVESEEVAPGIVFDFDADNRVIGIKIEDASKSIGLSRLEALALPIVDLVFRERASIEA
jgi:uncharacterized protein YuzE